MRDGGSAAPSATRPYAAAPSAARPYARSNTTTGI
jgi:hypothetical protein